FIGIHLTCFCQHGNFIGNPCGTMDSSWIDPLNATENPAVLTNIHAIQLGVYAGRLKDVKGLNFLSAAFAVPIKKLAAALVLHNTGSYGYQQTDLNLLLAKDLEVISLGLALHSKFVSVQSIAAYNSISVGIGLKKTSGQLCFGVSISGLSLSKGKGISGIGHTNKISSQCLYRASNVVSIGVIGSKEFGQPVSIQPAIFYRAGVINFSMGFDTLRNSFFINTGWIFRAYEVKMIFGYQATLGLSSGAELLYNRSK
ncbi:MAG TPA: hypothetical protein VLC28_08255, partial [Flavitalea sp.]|nr:hypothetical protein [Flavitalea sp.]